jgi:hypothetical protein
MAAMQRYGNVYNSQVLTLVAYLSLLLTRWYVLRMQATVQHPTFCAITNHSVLPASSTSFFLLSCIILWYRDAWIDSRKPGPAIAPTEAFLVLPRTHVHFSSHSGTKDIITPALSH